ncbi:MAG: sulfatase family protein [Sphaerochaetaceae bacterium]
MKNQPNILHIFTDMQRFDTIHALGNTAIKTPNLDRLVNKGVSFTSCYSPSPVCIAARCSMIYGQEPYHTGCFENTIMPTDGRQTFMDALSQYGYRTHGIGKCHFTPDRFDLKGFQSREVQEEGEESADTLFRNDYFSYLHEKGYEYICEPNGIRGEMYYTPQPSQLPPKDHPTQWVGDRSVAFIKEDHVQPWYLFSSFIHPHPPFTPPNPWHKLYRFDDVSLPFFSDDEELTFVNIIQNRYKYASLGLNSYQQKLIKCYYYACISFVDYQIGAILDALQESGQADNTLIIFSSDHGEYLYDHRCLGKRSMHDPAARVPMIVYQKAKFEGGKRCATPVSLIDIAPTILASAHLNPTVLETHPLDGKDLYKILTKQDSRDTVYSQLSFQADFAKDILVKNQQKIYLEKDIQGIVRFSTYMAVNDTWKYFYSAPDDKEFLFDREHDPHELTNLAKSPGHQCQMKRMRNILINHLNDLGETEALDAGDFKHFDVICTNDDPFTGLLIQDAYTPWANMELPSEYQDSKDTL